MVTATLAKNQESFLFPTVLRSLCLACPVLAMLAQAAPSAGAAPSPNVVGQFKEWMLVCADIDSKADTPDECFLNDVASDTSKIAVAVGHAHAKDGARVLAIQFAFKPGIDTKAGFTVAIDKVPVLQGTVADCMADVCQSAVAPVAPQLLDQMKRGTAMQVAYKTEAGAAVSEAVSLAGFTAAVAALSQRGPVAAAAPATSGSAPGSAPPPATATFRDWVLYCVDADGSAATPQSCQLNQVVQSTEPGKSIMAANIGFLPVEGGKKELAMQLKFPPATEKEAGIGILIDGKQLGTGPIAGCSAEFCQSVMMLSTEIINLMKQGTKMTIVFTLKDKGKVGAPLSLLGITAAIDALVSRS